MVAVVRCSNRAMSYAVVLTPEAEDDLEALLKSLTEDKWDEAERRVFESLEALGVTPSLAVRRARVGRPEYRLSFQAGGVWYHWACTFCYSQDEKSLYITHVFRTPM